jgi:two-component system CheB/CheR fusion protein
MQWVARINRALEENRFHLTYQPIVPIDGIKQAMVSYEFLLRMEDENGEVI